jgi:acetyl-CoA C-acetyltransferase
MGEHCELMVKEWKISRQEQDELALASHLNAAKAYKDGFYADLVFPFRKKYGWNHAWRYDFREVGKAKASI